MKKRKSLISAVGVLLLLTGFILMPHSNPPSPPPVPLDSRFLIGAMQTFYDQGNDYGHYDSLGFNLWHNYNTTELSNGRHYPSGLTDWDPDDKLFNPVSDYAANIRYHINIANQHNTSRLMLGRPKIEWLCYGQRSDYQCEYISPSDPLWFYSFQSPQHTGNDVPDNTQYGYGQMVRYCEKNINQTDGGAGWVVSRLKANTEQCRVTNNWEGDDECDWIVKPKIRIDSMFARTNPETPVCSLLVLNQNENVLKEVIFKAKYFQDVDGNYNGRYIEEFNFGIDPYNQIIDTEWGDNWAWTARGERPTDGPNDNKADIQVYWYGNCDMWIDYVRVDNDIADELFKGENDDWLEGEVKEIGVNAGTNYAPVKFYTELMEFNNLPCMAYVNKKLKEYSELHGNGHTIDLITDWYLRYSMHVPWNKRNTVMTAEHIKRFWVDSVGITAFYAECYPFNSTGEDYSSNNFAKIPNTLPTTNCASPPCGIMADDVSPAEFDDWLQDNLDHEPYYFSSDVQWNEREYFWTRGAFKFVTKLGDQISKMANIPFVMMPQAHSWYTPGIEIHNEPTNEEIELQSNIAITYGARGLQYFWYWSMHNPGDTFYSRGLVESTGELRRKNIYDQSKLKWQAIQEISSRIHTWDPYIMSFNDADRHSYIYKDEQYTCLQNEYFSNILSCYRGSQQVECMDSPPMPIPNDGLVSECREDTYLQVATFEKTENDGNNYFMIVNRRCSPLDTINHNDGERYIKVRFDSNHPQLNGDNWKITDVDSGWDTVINKNYSTHTLLLGWFQPGEGRLYKMEPMKRTGGILAGDEVISGESFTCEAPVYNNGHNITIGANTTIHFTDSAKFVMNGGVFTVGDQNTSAPQNITSDAAPGGSWRGHSFTNCEVKIYGATFTGLANDTTYAVNIIDCPVVDIRNSTFNTNSSLKGGISAVFYDNPDVNISNIYIGGNTFNSSGSTIPTVNISSYAGETTPLIIENNIFNEGNTAVFLNGVTGGAIKGNNITDNYIGINALTSSIDVVQNNISSTVNGSMGIFAAGGSELKLNSSGAFTLGGLNSISNEGTDANNINVDGSYFLLEGGENIFNISSDQGSYHLYGYFPMFTAVTTEETNNCFKVDDSPVDPPINMVTSGYQGTQITFNFNPYLSGCEIIGGGDGLAINLGDGIYDTIYTGGSGSGGSQKEALPLDKGEYPQGEGVYYKQAQIPPRRDFETASQFLGRGALVLSTPKQIYDSISVLMRYRNYTQAKTKCLDLINTYPDSIQSIFAVSKLFLATVASDTTYNAVNNLKIFYENLILNHPGNTSLVKRANYYILKCKVRMREYSQALAGFQQIINGNPYSYEGLIARWDYMATSLLVQGQGGGERGLSDLGSGISDLESGDLFQYLDDNPQSENRNPNSTGDKSPFTKEQRKDIRKSINTAIDVSKNNDETKIKKLEEKSELGDVNASKELTQMKSLKQVVKTEKPKSIIEHVRIVSEDIRKVFGSNTSSKGNEPKNIPLVFRISQNYPNPFNPVTKINYDLPKDSKVNIVIYDILGREVKRLVNNELKTAGSYIVDFNAMNYASGVYFYRIEAEEPNGSKFVDSKKMVLLK